MKKVTVVLEFDSVEAAVAYLQPPVIVSSSLPALPAVGPVIGESELPEPTPPATEKKARKPRSDAGQPRGPYKPRDESPAAPVPSEQHPATPQEAPGNAPATAPAAAAPSKELTIDDLKAAMTVLGKKHGIEANMKQLKEFGVEKVSVLPKEKYAAFHEAVRKAAGV